MGPAASLFDFNDVHVSVDEAPILAGVSTALPAGRLTVIAGVSGSGKSTLLRLCNRLEVPTSGAVSYRGEPLAGWDPRSLRRSVGMVFQQATLFPGTIRDNLRVAAPDADETARSKALAAVGLDAAFLDRIGDDLSGGEAQRACLARTLIVGPEVLLMDEPTASLHPAAARELENTVQILRRSSRVEVVWVTHDLGQIRRLAEHLVVLDSGRLAYEGAPQTPAATEALAALDGRAS